MFPDMIAVKRMAKELVELINNSVERLISHTVSTDEVKKLAAKKKEK